MPNTREKLIELIRDAKFDVDRICVERDWCDGCPAAYGEGDCKEAYIADHLIANGVTVQEWISVKDRLPEEYTYVLVCDVREDYVAEWEYRRNGVWHHEGCYYDNSDLTHWMPLPQPPKGE